MIPYLDSPQTIDHEVLLPALRNRLANSELHFYADNASDLYELVWPWANKSYTASIRLRVTSLIGDELSAISNRYFASHQETILGNETIIVSKRLMAPFKSSEDRSVIWNLECQAEGDHVLRLEVEIDWGEPLTQRMVDGLLVAQSNPQAPRGMYEQSNADSTRIFGNPQARPDHFEIDDPKRARLTYHVLVNGEVQVPLLLTISDVGEQMAWSTFLGLRESDETFDKSARTWEQTLQSGRLWTPDASLNQAVQTGKVLALRHLQHLRTGYAATDRSLSNSARLLQILDSFDPTASRNLLAHFRRIAERSAGRLPTHFPTHPKAEIEDAGQNLLEMNGLYLDTLASHLHHHFDAELLKRHFEAIQLCSETVIRNRWESGHSLSSEELQKSGEVLQQALRLANLAQDEANVARWQGEVQEFARLAGATIHKPAINKPAIDSTIDWQTWSTQAGWQEPLNQPWHFADPWVGIAWAGNAIWQGTGVEMEGALPQVRPNFPASWQWWALIDLPIGQGKLRLVWDGATLHSNLPILSELPRQQHLRIRILGFDELDWNPRFEFVDEGEEVERFYPKFTL